MAEQTIHVVQAFDRQGNRLVAARPLQFKTAEEAVGRAERDAGRHAGVVAFTQVVDSETGAVEDEPLVLARHGDLPAGLGDE